MFPPRYHKEVNQKQTIYSSGKLRTNRLIKAKTTKIHNILVRVQMFNPGVQNKTFHHLGVAAFCFLSRQFNTHRMSVIQS